GRDAPLSAREPCGDVVRTRAREYHHLSRRARQGGSLLSPPSSRCRCFDRLSWLPLVAGAPRTLLWHSGLLLRAAAALGVGRVARCENAQVRQSRTLYAAI